MELIDIGLNLMHKSYNKDRLNLMHEASKVGVKKAIITGSSISSSKNAVEYAKMPSLAGLVKDHATRIFENKAWKKIFLPMTIGLIAITLLVQPLFGKIDKEFPDSDNNGGQK